jgi:tetratricopeptide (TPR) repeat protein
VAEIPEPRIGDITEVEDAIRMAKKRPGRTVLFIGAGCSVSAGIPLVSAMAKALTLSLAETKDAPRNALENPLTAYRWLSSKGMRPCWKDNAPAPSEPATEAMIDWARVYDALFSDHFKTPDEVRDEFSKIIGGAQGRINWAHLCIGELVKRKQVLTAITTNFDQLLLAGMVRSGVLPVVCDGLDSLGRIHSAPSHPQIIELHGSRHTYRLLNAPKQVAGVAAHEPAIAAIRNIFQDMGAFIVVGYGGREDGVMDLLIRAATDAPDKRLMWIAHGNKTSELSEKARRFLATSENSRVLLGQDADSFFVRLLQKLEIGAPEAILDPLFLPHSHAHDLALHDSDDIAERTVIGDTIKRHRDEIGTLRVALEKHRQGRTAIDTALTTARTLRLEGKLSEAFEALQSIPDADRNDDIWRQLAEVALQYGQTCPDSDPLKTAVVAGLRVLESTDRKSDPLDWAAVQNHLGLALWWLGDRERSATRLEEAITAFRAALEERTRERVPFLWAATQNNLGNAVGDLGKREGTTARLDEAVAAYRAALQEHTRERVPLDWATTQNNLGATLHDIGKLESGTARLEEAVSAYRAALQERTRERVPLDWAVSQYNVGNALKTLGEREGGTARLEEAVQAYREALKESTRERVPLQWAATQFHLGDALTRLGERKADKTALEDAISAFRAALAFYEETKNDYAVATRSGLARAEALLAEQRATQP